MLKFYLLYAAFCAVWFGIRYRRSPRELAVKFSFAAAFPIIGFVFPLFMRPSSDERFSRIEKLEAYLRSDASETNLRSVKPRENDKELNLVPLEEALLIGDLASRRQTLIDLLNRDAAEHIEVLKLAVSNEDTETSHYAVSALVELKRKLNRSLQDLSVQYESSKENPVFLEAYAKALRNYIQSGFLDGATLRRLRLDLVEVLRLRIEADPQAFGVYEEKAAAETELRDLRAAEATARLFAERFPEREEPYLLLMNLYYSMRSAALFQKTLLDLKQSDVRLSSSGLKFVRFWSEGA